MVRFSAFHQDRGCLSRFFPLDRWGKRAPFLLTHCIIAATAASVVYMPPSTSSLRSLEMGGGYFTNTSWGYQWLGSPESCKKVTYRIGKSRLSFLGFPFNQSVEDRIVTVDSDTERFDLSSYSIGIPA
jgi:hypothetical protein